MSRQRPIRLGGRAVQGLEFEPAMSSFVGTLDTDIDVDSVLRELGFAKQERRFIIAHRIQGVTRSALPKHLGWTPQRVNAVRMRVERRRNLCQKQNYISPVIKQFWTNLFEMCARNQFLGPRG